MSRLSDQEVLSRSDAAAEPMEGALPVKRAAIYSRVSTENQADDGVSLEMQRQRLAAYAFPKGWEVSKYYEDAGYTSSNMNRPALKEMLQDAERGMFDYVLVYKLDRLSRVPAQYYTMSEKLDARGIGLVSITQDFDTTTPAGKLMQSMLIGFAGFERDLIIERTVDAEARMKELGTLVCGPAPFGFKHQNKKLFYDEETLPVAREILRRASSGEPERQVARALGLTRDQIRSVLHNPLFAGKIAYNKRGKKGTRLPYSKWMYVNYAGIEPILDFEDWLRLQQELNMRSDRKEGRTLPLFGRMIYCMNCKHLLSAHGSSRRNKTKYACQSAGNGQKACGAQLLEHNLLPVFLRELSEELRHFVPKFDGADRLTETDRKLAKYDRDIAQLEGRLAIPEVSAEKVRERIAALRTLKHEALQERAEIEEEKTRLEEVTNVLANFEPFFHSLDRKSQLEIVHRFARRIDLGVTHIVIHWRFSENECQVPRLEVSPRTRKTGVRGRVVEIGGLEPPTSCMPCRRSPS